jgi:hypothetical protein
VSSRRDHVSARSVSGKAGQVARILRLEASFRPLIPRAVYGNGRAADELYRTNPMPLDAWASGRATLASGTINIELGQIYE